MVEDPQVFGLAVVDVLDRGVVTEGDDLYPLQPHYPVGLGPASVVADAHPDHRVLHAPDPEPLVADIKVALFEMLERRLRQMLGMAGQVDLAVAADDISVRIDQDRGVVM